MTRSLGEQLPDTLRTLLDGSDPAAREGLTFQLLTTDGSGWPRMALLSVGEIIAIDPHTLRAALWLHSHTTRNLSHNGRAVLAVIAQGNGYYVRLAAQQEPDLDLGSDGRLACFAMHVEDVQEDSADYATLTSGVTFRLTRPDQVVPRWQRTIAALRDGTLIEEG